MKFYVNFEGSIMIEADSEEEAVEKLWDVNLDEAGYIEVTGAEKVEEV